MGGRHNSTRLKLAAGSLLVGAIVASAFPCPAQTLSDIARRDRERALNHPAAHVYTNQDFERPEILVPADRERFDAVRSDPYQRYVKQGSAAAPRRIPLADVARHYRWLEEQEGSRPPIMIHALPSGPALASPELTEPPANRPTINQPWQGRRASGATTAPKTAPARSVLAKRGDSLWKLAVAYLGSGRRWREIQAVNPQIKNPGMIEIGERIQMPNISLASQQLRQRRVRSGDTLWAIARVELGNGAAWSCIAEANPHIANPNLIYAGQILSIPSRCATGSSQASNLPAGFLSQPVALR